MRKNLLLEFQSRWETDDKTMMMKDEEEENVGVTEMGRDNVSFGPVKLCGGQERQEGEVFEVQN